jgi:hypothetical protein
MDSGALRRAIDEARTRALHLGKVALYQLSYYRIHPHGEDTTTLLLFGTRYILLYP